MNTAPKYSGRHDWREPVLFSVSPPYLLRRGFGRLDSLAALLECFYERAEVGDEPISAVSHGLASRHPPVPDERLRRGFRLVRATMTSKKRRKKTVGILRCIHCCTGGGEINLNITCVRN